MIGYVPRFAALLCPVLLLAACGDGSSQRTARLLDQRLETRLAPEISAGRAIVQPLSDGARVTLRDPTMFANNADALDNRENDVRARVVEALLDPSLMRVQVADTSTLPDAQRGSRVSNVVQYFVANGLAQTLQPTEPLQSASAGSAPEGLTLTIGVQCPGRNDGAGYGQFRPSCD
jgi:hypothetical protein